MTLSCGTESAFGSSKLMRSEESGIVTKAEAPSTISGDNKIVDWGSKCSSVTSPCNEIAASLGTPCRPCVIEWIPISDCPTVGGPKSGGCKIGGVLSMVMLQMKVLLHVR